MKEKTGEGGIRAMNVSYSYGNGFVLHDLSFYVTPGSVLSIIGPNGSGKTTLLKILAGLIPRMSGEVIIGEKRSSGRLEKNRLVGYVPQGHQSVFPFTVLDVVLTGRLPFISPWKSPSDTDTEIAFSCLKRVGAGSLASRSYTRISGGERQLVLIARSLAAKPSYLLLDEPTTFLDIRNQAIVLALIRKLSREGITVIMSIHDPSHAAQYSDQILLMKKYDGDGDQIVACGRPEQVLTPVHLQRSFTIPIRVIHEDGIILVSPVINNG